MVKYDIEDSDNGEEKSRWQQIRDKVTETVRDMGFTQGSLGDEKERRRAQEETEE